ncbi:replication factor RFC1 C terminal domain-containing protein [Mycena alexandri]|uniref:Replication factor C subunit 1 n=1 Tax=Mycena alexandri TaxID=1745969 RepID=A0AAD6TMB7_9AGAR|nr:replication factor RFC1 C terminal domain-containing protein [Mycena alexandri]
MAPSQKAAKPSQSNGKDIRAFFGGAASQKATPKPAESKKIAQPIGLKKADAIEILDSDDEPMPSVQKASSSKAVAKSSPVAPKEDKKPTLGAGPRKSAPSTLKPMDVDSDDEPVVKKRKKATALLSTDDDDEDTPPKKKAAAGTSKPKLRLSKAKDDDFVVSDDDEAPARKTTSRRASTPLFLPSDEDDDEPPKKKKTAASKPRPSKSKKDDFIVSSDDDEPAPKKTVAKPKPKATTSKPPAKAAAKGKEKVKEEPAKEKFNWAAARAAKLAGPSAPGSKAVPDGEPNCLAGLALVFTGELSSFSREESVEIAKRYGARVPGQPSGKTDYVVLGDNAGPSKLAAIKKHGLRTLDEDGFLDLIATRKGTGQFDEKTLKKMQKDKEAIETAAKEMEKREKKEAKEASGSSKIDPSSQLWTTRYAPQNIKEICGNKTQVERLQQWLHDWPNSVKSGFKKPGQSGMNIYRAVMITGPPGIGKTTSAHMVAKLEGFTPIELNASDARSKKLVENGMNVNNKSLDGYIAGSRERDGVAITDRTVLIMDEVDGMSAGDRGGVGALNAMIKKSKVPIICIANDRGAQKLKPLIANTFSMIFQRPQAQAIRSRLMTIAFKEKMQVPANVLDQLVQSSQSDIRQVLNMLSTWRLSNTTMNFDEGKSLAQMNEKYTIMSPFDITSKVMGPKLFASNSRATLGDKMELYFQDHSLVPLMIQENYLKSEPMRLKNYDGPMKILKSLELMDNAASSISDGDLVDALIHGPEQHWALMPLHAVCSTIRPASFMYGMGVHWGGSNPMSFPAWLGQNSKQSKLNRQLGEVQIRMRLKVSGDKSEIRQSYIPALFPHIVKPLMDVGASAVEEVIERMDEYYLTKEDWDAIVELGVDDKKDDFVLKKISTATKTNLTKKYNASEHPIPFHKADAGKPPKKLPGGPAPDLDDVFDIDEPSEDTSDDDKGSKDADDDDFSKDKMIKAPKKKRAAKAAPKTTKAKK